MPGKHNFKKMMGYKDGGSLKRPTNKGLASLPTEVRNKMGFMKKGGKPKGYMYGGKVKKMAGGGTPGMRDIMETEEYKKVMKETCTLTEDGDADIMVQGTSRYRTWVQASRQYNIGNIDEITSVRQTSDHTGDEFKSYRKQFTDFLEKESSKRPSNDKAGKNPDTPEA